MDKSVSVLSLNIGNPSLERAQEIIPDRGFGCDDYKHISGSIELSVILYKQHLLF